MVIHTRADRERIAVDREKLDWAIYEKHGRPPPWRNNIKKIKAEEGFQKQGGEDGKNARNAHGPLIAKIKRMTEILEKLSIEEASVETRSDQQVMCKLYGEWRASLDSYQKSRDIEKKEYQNLSSEIDKRYPDIAANKSEMKRKEKEAYMDKWSAERGEQKAVFVKQGELHDASKYTALAFIISAAGTYDLKLQQYLESHKETGGKLHNGKPSETDGWINTRTSLITELQDYADYLFQLVKTGKHKYNKSIGEEVGKYRDPPKVAPEPYTILKQDSVGSRASVDICDLFVDQIMSNLRSKSTF
jgi:hypothetical protein